ncbi:MAG: hypothetical protein LBM77_06330 [Spirochaetaceae bacterium]|jgi:hypothetical protein|nr:hypothetical protein [Spirochaetaceae bacterium]
MNEIKDLIEKTINPPGILKKNRKALFDTIRDIYNLVRTDALTAFNAHFPYLADSKKLEEHGEALLIPHLLHDTEAEYRERVATASFFLMKAGERQYIMGQLEERFPNRYKIIEEFLNIHLKVTDLTDDERQWALELLDSLLNPVIYTELSEWFHYIENISLFDNAAYTIDRGDIDFFEEKILRDGRILRDGKTIYNRKVKVYRDGYFQRNGRYGRTGEYEFPDTNVMRLPLTRGSGYRDIFTATYKKLFSDTQYGAAPRDGSHPRDGSWPRGWATAFEIIPPLAFSNTEIESLPSADLYPTKVQKDMSDTHVNSILRDGSRPRNGMLQRANIVDEAYLNYTAPMSDAAVYKIWRDGKLPRDGSGKRTGFGDKSMAEHTGEQWTVEPLVDNVRESEAVLDTIQNNSSDTYVNSILRDGSRPRNGELSRSNIHDTDAMRYKAAAMRETVQYKVWRDGRMVKRDGSGTRTGFGNAGIYEMDIANIKLPQESDLETVLDQAFNPMLTNYSSDLFQNTIMRDGSRLRDGKTYRSNFIADANYSQMTLAAMQEQASIDEEFNAGMRKHHFRNGEYLRDGSILRDSMMLLPL